MTQVELFSAGPGDSHAWADRMLAPLDLSVELLHQVIEAGHRRREAANPLAPTMAAAIEQWSAMVAELRSRTSWRADELGGLPRTIHPSGRFFIVVRAGAGDVGAIEPVVPTTKHRLGPMLCKLIDGLPPSTIPLFTVNLDQVDPDGYHEPTPWLLLVASPSRDGAIHAELSQPARRDGEVITGYTQRIPLPPVTFGATTVELPDVAHAGPELDIQPLP